MKPVLATVLTVFLFLSGCSSWPGDSGQPQLQSLARIGHSDNSRRQLEISQWQTSSGTRVLFVQAGELPMFDIRLTFAAGSSKDGTQHGLAAMTSTLLDQGSSGLAADQIASGFEELGARFSHSSHRDMALISLRSLSDEKLGTAAVELFSQVIAAPEFAAPSLARQQNLLRNSFNQEHKDPAAMASKELFLRLYGEHPYAHPPSGTATSINAFTPQMLQNFYRQFYTAQNAQLVMVGDLSHERARAISERITSALPSGRAADKAPQATAPAPGHWHLDMDIQQTHIYLAQPGIGREHPDFAALYLANQVFGGSGFGSRLMSELREQRGLTYGVYSGLSPMQSGGSFVVSVQTRTETAQQALVLLRQLQQELVTQGITQAELDSAKRQITGSYPLANASNSAIVSQLAMLAFYGLPLDWQDQFIEQINQLSLQQVNQAIGRHLQPEQQILISVGAVRPEFEQ